MVTTFERHTTSTTKRKKNEADGHAGEGPGKRWKFSVAYDGLSMMVFGGHRLWHGFATDNSEANSWSSFVEYPEGGYLQDLWVYTKKQLAEDEQVNKLCETTVSLGSDGVA